MTSPLQPHPEAPPALRRPHRQARGPGVWAWPCQYMAYGQELPLDAGVMLLGHTFMGPTPLPSASEPPWTTDGQLRAFLQSLSGATQRKGRSTVGDQLMLCGRLSQSRESPSGRRLLSPRTSPAVPCLRGGVAPGPLLNRGTRATSRGWQAGSQGKGAVWNGGCRRARGLTANLSCGDSGNNGERADTYRLRLQIKLTCTTTSYQEFN